MAINESMMPTMMCKVTYTTLDWDESWFLILLNISRFRSADSLPLWQVSCEKPNFCVLWRATLTDLLRMSGSESRSLRQIAFFTKFEQGFQLRFVPISL